MFNFLFWLFVIGAIFVNYFEIDTDKVKTIVRDSVEQQASEKKVVEQCKVIVEQSKEIADNAKEIMIRNEQLNKRILELEKELNKEVEVSTEYIDSGTGY